MAERQFLIIIRGEALDGGAGNKLGGAGGIQDSLGGETTQSGGKEKLSNAEKAGNLLTKKMLGLVSYGAVTSTINRVWSHHNSLIEVKTGSREQQERQTYIYNNVSSLVNSTVGGAMAGASVAGLPGLAVGAAIGLVSSITNYGINYAMQTDVISKNRQLEDVTRQLSTQRVTISGSRYMNVTQM